MPYYIFKVKWGTKTVNPIAKKAKNKWRKIMKEDKDRKDYQVKVRLTQEERILVQEYAENNNLTMSEVVRQALYRMIGGK